MFKSVFSRIMSTFSVILLISIMLLVFVVASGLYQESEEKALSELGVAANEVGFFLEGMQKLSSLPTALLLQSSNFRNNIAGVASFTDSDISVLRMDGVVAVTASELWNAGDRMLTEETVSDLVSNSRAYAHSDLNGALPKKMLNSFALIQNTAGEPIYLIVVTARSDMTSDLANSVTKRMIAVSIWIFFAAMICISLISRRVTDPIKQIGEASKEYAQGRFNVRVQVEGQDEIAELGRAFNNMATGLATHEENRNTFLANVSHDLRTPMTTISGFIDGILDGTIPPEQHQKYLQTISGEIHRLSRLVNTLLEVSRLESGRNMTMSDFNLTEKARQIVISLVGKIEAKKLDVQFEGGEEDVFVTANPDAIHQVLYNLLDNAVKFTQEAGTITVRINVLRGKKVQVCIRNTGEGIPAEEISHIFERFYKSDRSRGLDKTGTGLGLYIVKTILDKHGEDITVRSEVGSYTEFCFGLSVAAGRPRAKNLDVSDAELQ